MAGKEKDVFFDVSYIRRSLFRGDGFVHVQRAESNARRSGGGTRSTRLTKKQAREIEICLHCTKKECTGGEGCFGESRKEREKVK